MAVVAILAVVAAAVVAVAVAVVVVVTAAVGQEGEGKEPQQPAAQQQSHHRCQSQHPWHGWWWWWWWFPHRNGLQRTGWRRPVRPAAQQGEAGAFQPGSSMHKPAVVQLWAQSEHPSWYSREGLLSANDGAEHARCCVRVVCVCAPSARLLQRNTCRISALAMRNSGHTRLELGLVVLLHVERTVEFHDNSVHDEHLDHAGIERMHHANDVINIASRQLLSKRLQRGGRERRRTRIARTHFSPDVNM